MIGQFFDTIIGASTNRVVINYQTKSSVWKVLRNVLTHLKFPARRHFRFYVVRAWLSVLLFIQDGALCETAGQHTENIR